MSKEMNKILIANRGEIASRVIRTCKKMGIKSVVLYAQDDRDLLYCDEADEKVSLGFGSLAETYLNQEKIIAIAKEYKCDGIYPGYGFLSENAEFCKKVSDASIEFIGPTADVIKLMGDKKASKVKMQEIGIPLVPGYHGEEQGEEFLKAEAEKIGYPVLIKATAGGGGKGMRIVHQESEFIDSLSAAKREAKNAFGNDKVLIEKYLVNPRHIEVQLVSDGKGNHLHFFERECSIQRRYQKVVEETPAIHLGDSLRRDICETAVKIAKAINYKSAGTVEFILSNEGKFYFLEMNTRLQVEHPITEMVTGTDLVELQLLAAAGKPFDLTQNEITQNGHAIECRIYAEDPDHEFLPTNGRIQKVRLSEMSDYRFDCSLRDGNSVSLVYDPMLAKVIAHAENRNLCLTKMNHALSDVQFGGVKTNRNFLKRILNNEHFKHGPYTTSFLSEQEKFLRPTDYDVKEKALLIAASVVVSNETTAHNLSQRFCKEIILNDESILAEIEYTRDAKILISLDKIEGAAFCFSYLCEKGKVFLNDGGENIEVFSYQIDVKGNRQIIIGDKEAIVLLKSKINYGSLSHGSREGSLNSPMPGKIFKLIAKKGDALKKGDPVLIVEAMKMEHVIKSTKDGVLKDVFFNEGEQVMGGVLLCEIE